MPLPYLLASAMTVCVEGNDVRCVIGLMHGKWGQTRSDQRLLVDQGGGRNSVSQCLFILVLSRDSNYPGFELLLDQNYFNQFYLKEEI